MSFSRWMLADLQIHTPADKEQKFGDVGGPEPNEAFARTLIEAHAKAGVEILAVTDHNRVDWWPILNEIGEKLGVFVFPGLEINVGKCHLMAIWDRSEQGFRLAQRFLDSLFDAGEEPLEADRTPKPVLRGNVLDKAKEAVEGKALVLAPHSTASRMGLFGRNVCNISGKVAKSPFVSGFDIIGNKSSEILKSPKGEFGRRIPPWFSSGDVRSLDDVGKRACFFKTGPEPTLESLRQAFLMPETRIRLRGELRTDWSQVKHANFLDDPEPHWGRITSVAIDGGFHDELKVELGPGLNAVIGGKGTGKSTLIEILRFSLEAPPSIAPKEMKDGRGNLSSNFPSNAEARIGYSDGDSESYEVVRAGNSTKGRLSRDSNQLDIEPRRRIKVRVFGQRELAELPSSAESLAEFVLSRAKAEYEDAEAEVSDALEAARKIGEELDDLDAELSDRQELQEELDDLTDRLSQIVKEGSTDLALESEGLQQADAALGDVFEWPSTLLPEAEALQDAAPPPLPDHELVPRGIKTAQTTGAAEVRKAAKAVVNSLKKADRELEKHRKIWGEAFDKKQEGIDRLLADAGLDDPSELSGLQSRKAELDRQLKASKAKEKKRAKLLPKRAGAIEALAEKRRKRSRLLKAAVDDLNSRTGKRVRIGISPLSDIAPLVDFLGDEVTGRKLSPGQIGPLRSLSPQEIANAAFSKEGRPALDQLGLTASLADCLEEAAGERLRRLEEVDKPDVVTVEVNLAEKGSARWTDVKQASPGQAATAMLELALIASDEPLLIDQPEDDLDNRFIYDEVVQKVAEVAAGRQVIVATHNANIPVLGDAELVLALDATTNQGEVLACGGLDQPEVAETAREILEGGEAAFEARARRYAEGGIPT